MAIITPNHVASFYVNEVNVKCVVIVLLYAHHHQLLQGMSRETTKKANLLSQLLSETTQLLGYPQLSDSA